MGQAKVRQAEIAALKAVPKAAVCKMQGANFVITYARDLKTNEIRMQATPNKFPLMDMFSVTGDLGVCEFKVREYIARDDDLSQIETMHFTNWCLGVQNSKAATEVEVMVAGVATLAEAHAVINHLKTR